MVGTWRLERANLRGSKARDANTGKKKVSGISCPRVSEFPGADAWAEA
jgi:hypothetical protein